MLVHNGGYMQPHCYYPDPSYFPQHATLPPQHFDIDAFLSHPSAYQAPSPTAPSCQQALPQHAAFPHHQQQQHYNHHSACYRQQQDGGAYNGSCSCGCAPKPVQETFLHKILTGKGYKNDTTRPTTLPHQTPAAHFLDSLECGASLEKLACSMGSMDSLYSAGSMDNLHCASYSAHTAMEADFAMAASCCYASGMPSLPVSAAAFPPSFPAF
ncbi:uncharacterized protein [Littorina saxatilis]|uniref:Uncharacterized protein n=1 Tax=Littorina saxatilis TaxID=31220 RepID=A0AAN9GE49_9CAEN